MSDTVRKPRPGRPRREPEPGERVVMSFRVTPSIKYAIEGAAEENGRSQAQEIEARLERSFRDEEILVRLDAILTAIRGGG